MYTALDCALTEDEKCTIYIFVLKSGVKSQTRVYNAGNYAEEQV